MANKATQAGNASAEPEIDHDNHIDAPFTEGSVFRHVIIMTLTGAVGLMSVFAVDLMDMYFLSLLDETELPAAIGFAGTVVYFTASVCIGLSIAIGALTARAVGQKDRTKTSSIVVNTLTFSVLCAIGISAIVYPLLGDILTMIGAFGKTHALALTYGHILLPSLPLVALGMGGSAVLRALGDARRAMHVMVITAIVNGILDPIFIFGLDLGLEGAAYASVLSRVSMALAGMYAIFRIHKLKTLWSNESFIATLRPVLKIAVPAVLTNIATPVGNAYVIAVIAEYGDSVVAGNTIVARITPVAFALFFSMSGSIGPVLGQNLGARLYDRVHETVASSLRFIFAYSLVTWAFFVLVQDLIIMAFSADGPSADMIRTFCVWVVPLTSFLGALFVANASFNNLGYPLRATFFNISKATIGTIPFAYFGAELYGPEGVLIGQAIGSMFVGIVAVIYCFKTIHHVAHKGREEIAAEQTNKDEDCHVPAAPLMPYSSARAYHAAAGNEPHDTHLDDEDEDAADPATAKL